jgi:hypothetical protein
MTTEQEKAKTIVETLSYFAKEWQETADKTESHYNKGNAKGKVFAFNLAAGYVRDMFELQKEVTEQNGIGVTEQP